jgi:hypothetical protein
MNYLPRGEWAADLAATVPEVAWGLAESAWAVTEFLAFVCFSS